MPESEEQDLCDVDSTRTIQIIDMVLESERLSEQQRVHLAQMRNVLSNGGRILRSDLTFLNIMRRRLG